MSSKHPKRKERPGVDQYGRTPLHHAAADGNVEQVRTLVASGSDPGASDDDGWTPLHFAIQANSASAVALLLDAGAPVDARDAHGNTPLLQAVFESRGSGDLIRLLRAREADSRAENFHGVSPVSLARMIGNFNVRPFLEDLSEDLDG